MKEIKFRAKKLNSDEWVYGFYFEKVRESGIPANQPKRTFIKYETWDEGFVTEEVIPDTIGQFTGLKDKNGKEIYESDIVEWAGHKMKVIWEEITGCGYGFTWIPANEDIDSYCESMTGFIDEYGSYWKYLW